MRLFNLKSNKERRKSLRKNMTKAEVKLWQELRRKQMRYKFRRQFGIGPFITDFYCPKLKFAIELDGDVHFIGNAQEKDFLRTKFLLSKGVFIKRYLNNEVIYNLEMVLEDIWQTCDQLAKQNSVSETKCTIGFGKSLRKL